MPTEKITSARFLVYRWHIHHTMLMHGTVTNILLTTRVKKSRSYTARTIYVGCKHPPQLGMDRLCYSMASYVCNVLKIRIAIIIVLIMCTKNNRNILVYTTPIIKNNTPLTNIVWHATLFAIA